MTMLLSELSPEYQQVASDIVQSQINSSNFNLYQLFLQTHF